MTPLPRALAAETVGTAGLLAAVVGSGIMAQRLTDDVGIQLLANAVASIAALGVLIAVIAPVSGAHFNPAVSLAQAVRRDLPWSRFPGYAMAQVLGGVLGVVVANLMYDLAPLHLSGKARTGVGQWIGEVVATAGLVLVVGFVSRGGRGDRAPWLVAAWILAAYWFTSSTSFANPAVTIARMFSDTFAGIAPADVLPFVIAQVTGAGIGLAGIQLLVPEPKGTP
ncbi:MIP family protein [Knoellia subterranea KCTC 19937]|uniref:MIP family protein n=1 Tax=Knoellia subterranea KCTC 19937 TaxID=1385521 RepID=A0A0A0JGU0_9MICO|nr:MIP/aquaporin family protein [Knoellia subterranea]KGN36620.1 MIP family protein [Knoellia subterranea KCTC 19937]